MHKLKMIFIIVATLFQPGFSQIIGGRRRVGCALFLTVLAANCATHWVDSFAIWIAAFTMLFIPGIISASILIKNSNIASGRAKGFIIFVGMLLASALSNFGPELRSFSISATSMAPTLEKGVVLMTRSVRPDELTRGDIIVFKKPTQKTIDYIKRVVGFPGEKIQIINGVLHINDTPVKRRQIENYYKNTNVGGAGNSIQYEETLPEGKEHRIIEFFGDNGPADNTQAYFVPENHLFVLGDNRDNSADSRFLSEVGYVPYANVGYRALWIIRPFPMEIEPVSDKKN